MPGRLYFSSITHCLLHISQNHTFALSKELLGYIQHSICMLSFFDGGDSCLAISFLQTRQLSVFLCINNTS